jgi:murein DD-endopeptidase MepM/ murein hydrolase activator NlpD
MLKRILAAVVALILVIFGFVWFSGKDVALKLAKPVTAIGNDTPISVQADGPHGVKSFSAIIEQNGQRQAVFEDKTKSRQSSRIFTFSAGKKQASFLKEGPAKLVVQAASNDFRSETTTLNQDFQVVLRPPTIVADGFQHYINQGGAELVAFDLGGAWTEAGVHASKYSAASFPMPGQPDNSNRRFSLFPYPWDLSADTIPVAFVRNIAGTEVSASFWVQVFPKAFKSTSIELRDEDVQKVVNELDPEGSGDPITRFVKINREIRKENAQTIYDLRLKTENRMLWSGPFIPMKGKRESYFADRRSYFYKGKKVDEQVHLGFDLAQNSNTPIMAANSGKIVYADRLGIYGNCVIVDHGYSLQTLYGHMSRIDVKVGDSVAKGQRIGVTGKTGMAFGDHLHFSTLVGGVPVNPIEWWDEHWIHDRILSKIGPAKVASREK